MTKLTIIRGVSGSGKSTWAAQQNAKIVSRDAIRIGLFGIEFDPAIEQDVTLVEHAMINAYLKNGHDVISDNTNIEWKFVKAIAKVGYLNNASVEIKVFDAPLQKCIDNNNRRAFMGGRDVPEEVIRRQHQRFQGNKSKELDPVIVPKPYTGTPGKPKAVMVDVDGTLAHMNGRGPFDWKRVGEDDPDENIASLVWTFKENNYEDYSIIIMSGRDSVCRPETEEWLITHGILYDHIYMRPEKDMRPDNIVKAELFDTYVRDNFDVKFVLDDRDQVVQMWRSMGLTCLQVAEGAF